MLACVLFLPVMLCMVLDQDFELPVDNGCRRFVWWMNEASIDLTWFFFFKISCICANSKIGFYIHVKFKLLQVHLIDVWLRSFFLSFIYHLFEKSSFGFDISFHNHLNLYNLKNYTALLSYIWNLLIYFNKYTSKRNLFRRQHLYVQFDTNI